MVHVVGFVAFAAATALMLRVAYAVWTATAALQRAVGRMEATVMFAIQASPPPAPVEAPTPPDTTPPVDLTAEPEPEAAPAMAQGSRNIAVERLSRNLDEQLRLIDLGKRRTEESAITKVARASGTIVIPPRR